MQRFSSSSNFLNPYASGGKANPAAVNEILKQKLGV